MVCSDVDGLEVDNFKAQIGDGVAAAKLDGVKNIVIRNSPVLKDVATTGKRSDFVAASPVGIEFTLALNLFN